MGFSHRDAAAAEGTPTSADQLTLENTDKNIVDVAVAACPAFAPTCSVGAEPQAKCGDEGEKAGVVS